MNLSLNKNAKQTPYEHSSLFKKFTPFKVFPVLEVCNFKIQK